MAGGVKLSNETVRIAWETTRQKVTADATDMIAKAFKPMLAENQLLAKAREFYANQRTS